MEAYLIKPEHVGQQDLHQFLHAVIDKEFEGKNYAIVGEVPMDRLIPGRQGIRKLIALNVESGPETHAIDRKSTRLNSSHEWISRMPSSA